MLIRKNYSFLVGILFVFCLYPSNAFSKLVFTRWDKEVVITVDGQEVHERIYVRAELPKNQYYKTWKYIFNKKDSVKIIDLKMNRAGARPVFRNNEIIFNFKNLFSGQSIVFDVKYERFNKDENKYMKAEFVTLPSWIDGAESKVKVNVSSDLVVYSTHKNLTKNGNNYYWTGKVSKVKPFQELFLLTPIEGKWRVKISGNAIGDDNFREAKLSIPKYFKNGPFVIETYDLTTNVNGKYKVKEKNNYYHFDFADVNSRLLSGSVFAVIKNGDANHINLNVNPTDFLDYQVRHRNDYADIIRSVRSNTDYNGLQEYQGIVDWVHNYIKYDEAAFGNEMTIEEILKVRRGVCSQYSKLFVELSRYVGIPAFSVAGLSYNIDKGEFIDHAWAYIYVMGNWIPMDPTWNIYSGKLPISHIYTYGTIENVGVSFTSYGYKNQDSIKTNIRNEVEFIE
jgi:hypothetical protein